MEHVELLRYAAGVLRQIGARYFVTGSTASIFFGEPRFTNDIDIVADLTLNHIDAFLSYFPAEHYYVSSEAARDAVWRHSMFNIIHPESGLKVDIIIPEPTALNESRFNRVREVAVGDGVTARLSSPEDTILHKMIFYQEGGSEKHLRDIAGILRVSGEEIDRNYIADWAKKLDLGETWLAILAQLGAGDSLH